MASGRTGDQIISDALKLLGNETLTTEALVWLNNILDRLFEDYRWPFSEKTTTGTVSGSTITVPSDFTDVWNEFGFKLLDSDGNQFSMRLLSSDDYDLLPDPTLTAQMSESVYINRNTGIAYLYPVPTGAATYEIRYKYKPTRLTTTAAGSVVAFPNDMLLTQAVYVRGLQHEDDDRYASEAQALENMIHMYLKGKNFSPLKSNRLTLMPSTFRNISSRR